MSIETIRSIAGAGGEAAVGQIDRAVSGASGVSGFAETLGGALQKVDQIQMDADVQAEKVAMGGGTPRPRNDSEASIRIVEPSCAVASTISGASVFGRMWRIAIRLSDIPVAFAASTNGCSRRLSVFERMTRAT